MHVTLQFCVKCLKDTEFHDLDMHALHTNSVFCFNLNMQV